MILIFILYFFVNVCEGKLTLQNIDQRLLTMLDRINYLETEIKVLKSKNGDLKPIIDLKEIQDDLSYILMEQVKIKDRIRALRTKIFD